MIPNPFEPRRLIGQVWKVSGASLHITALPASSPNDVLVFGKRIALGRVGEYVVAEDGELAVIGRIMTLTEDIPSPDSQRDGSNNGELSPVGIVQILTSLDLSDSKITSGLPRFPRLGSCVYSASPDILQFLVENYKGVESEKGETFDLATLPEHPGVAVRLSPSQLLGRHCAILGSTGGGKSWTMTRLIEEAAKLTSKIILLDATGEYELNGPAIKNISIGRSDCETGILSVDLPYTELTEQDLVAIFQPSSKSQLPKFREALRSLKLTAAVGSHTSIKKGMLVKANSDKATIHELFKDNAEVLFSPSAEWNVNLLSGQIENECVWPNGKKSYSVIDESVWGDLNQTEIGYCSTLVARIESYVNDRDFDCIFKPTGELSVFDHINSFVADSKLSVLRISLRDLSFALQIREIIANVLGRYLLKLARTGEFEQSPLLVCVDEAHQFLNKSIGDDDNRYALEAFEIIAKEGRKYSLNICLATQRPRDIPEGVLSQIGTFVVHRLTNHHDREVVERACGDMDRSATSFLPTLPEGHALIVGVDFPLPLPVKIKEPVHPPNSRSAQYNEFWKRRSKEVAQQEAGQSISSEISSMARPDAMLPLDITERRVDPAVVEFDDVVLEHEDDDDLPF